MKKYKLQHSLFSLINKSIIDIVVNNIKKSYLLLSITFLLGSCGTLYIPQVLPEARGVGRSIGQEDVSVKIIPVTHKSLKIANAHPYIRRVIDASDLNQEAKLVSVEDAIKENLPPSVVNRTPYTLGVGDELQITQRLNIQNITQEINQNEGEANRRSLTTRSIKIADDGFVAILGIGRLQLEGLTQFEAEDLIYQAYVRNEINPEFELQISKFESKKVYLSSFSSEIQYTPSLTSEAAPRTSNFISVPFTNTEIYLHQLLNKLTLEVKKGQDSLIILKRNNNAYRMSLRKVLNGELEDILVLANDRIFVESLPYRPETAILTGEVKQEKLIIISAEQRQSLAEAIYGQGGTIIVGQSDPSQLFVIRELPKKNIVAYHLDSSNPARLTLATRFELRPNDIIFVAPQFVTNYNRALMQIVSAYAVTKNASLE